MALEHLFDADNTTGALSAAAHPSRALGEEAARHAERSRAAVLPLDPQELQSRPPDLDELADAASDLALDVRPTLAKLVREDLVLHDSATGAILVAYPFSGRPTAHRVSFENSRKAFAMCAIDALGIAPMLGEPIDITSQDPLTDDEIWVGLAPEGRGSWKPDGAVVVCGASGNGESCTSCCPVLNFFASQDNATRWPASHPEVRGAVMSIDEAIVAGRAVFGDILEEE